MIPLFPELRPYLEAAFDEAPARTEYAVMRYRQRNSNLRTQLLRIIGRAGVTFGPSYFTTCGPVGKLN